MERDEERERQKEKDDTRGENLEQLSTVGDHLCQTTLSVIADCKQRGA